MAAFNVYENCPDGKQLALKHAKIVHEAIAGSVLPISHEIPEINHMVGLGRVQLNQITRQVIPFTITNAKRAPLPALYTDGNIDAITEQMGANLNLYNFSKLPTKTEEEEASSHKIEIRQNNASKQAQQGLDSALTAAQRSLIMLWHSVKPFGPN